MSDVGLKKQASSAADVRRDVEEIRGTDIFDQDKLEDICEKIWLAVPPAARARFTSEDWQLAIHDRCRTVMMRAEERLEENKVDDRMFAAKVRILRQTFSNQVVRAMQSVAARSRKDAARGR